MLIPKILIPIILSARISSQPVTAGYNYKEALKLSLLFYEAQRSGILPESNRISWRSDSALNDQGFKGEDLTGGYYDAADFVKFGFTIAYSMTILAWGLVSYEETYRRIGQHNATAEAIKWGTDYIIKCHTAPFEFYAQVGDFPSDHKFWGRPEELNMTRPAHKIDKDQPGSDVAAEAAAALASASIVFQKIDPDYSHELIRHSTELFDFAYEYRGLFLDTFPGSKHYHENDDYYDELAWAAIWLYKATRLSKYAEIAKTLYTEHNLNQKPKTFFYNSKYAGIQVLLSQEFKNQEYVQAIKEFCDFAVDGMDKTPKGLIYINKLGTLAHAASISYVCLQASNFDKPEDKYVNLAKDQAAYILGSTGFSYLVGYGDSYPKQPHHAASSCKDLPAVCNWDDFRSTKPNPQILYGALVSGPSQIDHYEDVREEYLYNEVTIDYNAGLHSLLAGLMQHFNS